ncbi:MAG: DUF1028 domain-containing protein [Candidatus Sulfomarinibacteraceae bacterium]
MKITTPLACLLITLVPFSAGATWSIVATDSETQEVVVASATCLTGFDLKQYLPVVVVGRGGGAAQSYVDNTGVRRTIIWDGLHSGATSQTIVDQLVAVTNSHLHQHGVAESSNPSSGTQTGASCGAHASGVTGSIGSLRYAIQGNVLTGSPVIDAAETAFVTTAGDLPAKTMAAMEAARSMGGDGRCSCSPSAPTSCGSPPPSFDKAADVGFLVVSRFGDTDDPACTNAGCADGDYFMDFNIAFQTSSDPDPVLQLQALFDAARLDLVGRPDAIASTIDFSTIPGPDGRWLLRVELRDWQGDPIGHSVAGFTVEHAPDSDQVTTIGAITDLGNGAYEVILTETAATGVDVFLITADDGVRPVVLPPRRATLDLVPLFADGFESGTTSGWSSTSP